MDVLDPGLEVGPLSNVSLSRFFGTKACTAGAISTMDRPKIQW